MTLRTAELINLAHGVDDGKDLFIVDLRFVLDKKEFSNFMEILDTGFVQINGVWKK